MQSQDLSTNQVTQTQQSQQQTIYLTSTPISPQPKIQYQQIGNFFTKKMQKNMNTKIYSTQFLTQDMFLAIGCDDGAVRVMSTTKWDAQYILRNIDHSPVSCLSRNNNSSKIKNSVMATHTDGTLQYWHATSQQLLFSKKYNQCLQCCQISYDGQYYAFGGQSGHLYMGSLTKGNPLQLQAGHLGSHDNRIFCIKWNPFDNNMFFTGGWDKTVFVWDIRIKTSVSKIYGSYIGGKAIDVNNKMQLLLGNNTNQTQLRVYDMKTQKARKIDWKPASQRQINRTTGVLSCYFGQNDNQILACSSMRDIRLFNQNKCLSRYQHQNWDAKIFSFSKSNQSKICAIGWNNGDLELIQY